MASITLIRHGQASFGQENYDQLSELGFQQATRLGQVMSQRMPIFDAIYVGGMQRHQQTARNCVAEFGHTLDALEPIYDAGWNEYDHQDVLAQLRPEFSTAASLNDFIAQQENPKQVFEQSFNDAIDRWMAGGNDADYLESWTEFSERVHAALENVVRASKAHKSIAVFTSGGPISMISQALLGVPPENIMKMNWTLVNCGLTKLVSAGSRLFIASLNEHSHFEGDQNKQYLTYT